METIHSAPTGRKAFSVGEFCRIHSISRAMFYKLAKIGMGPRTMKVGAKQLISEEAAAAWRAERTAANGVAA